MSIMQIASTPPASSDLPERLDSGIRELLDHIAVDLAHEYVRLMESAADAEAAEKKEKNQ